MPWNASVLVVANVTASSDALLRALRDRHARGPTSFTLLVPAGGRGPAHRAAAARTLDAALARLRDAGLTVEGRVGDPDPVAALDAIWDPRAFDEIVISTLPTGASHWLRADLPHRVERMTGVQVTHVVADERAPVPGVEPAAHEHPGVLSPLRVLGWGATSRPADH